jgi:sugar-specific transcriptional regulator TrmB
MTEIFEIFKEIGFSINEAKVYTALVAKNPINGYEVAKRANVTRTMVYDILNRMVSKGVVEVIIQNGTNLYTPVPYKELFQKMKEDYNNRLEIMEEALDNMESDQRSDNYIRNISDYESMITEIKSLISSAKHEIYLSIWEEEARLFADDLRAMNDKGVKIITFSFCRIPYDFGINYSYGIPTKELNKIWSRRRITVVVDRERILIGEGNDAIEEISIITSNTMLTEMSIDQITLDIIHLHELQKGNFLPESITSIEQYKEATARFQGLLNMDLNRLPKRADQD